MEDIKMLFGNYNMNMFQMNPLGGSTFPMGIGNMFGCGSVFGSSIFNNCDGSYNFDAMAGVAVADTIFQYGGNLLGNAIAKKKQGKVEQENLRNEIENLNSNISNYLEKLGCNDEDKALAYSIEDDETTITLNTLESELNSKKDAFNKYESDVVYTNAINAYDEASKKDPQPENINELKTAAENAKTALKEKEALEKEIKALEDTKIPAAEKAKQAREKEIDNIQNELEKAIEARDELQERFNEAVLNKADGTKFNRTKKSKFDNKDFSNPDTKVTQQDIRRAIAEYRTAQDPTVKAELKTKIQQIYSKLPAEDRSNSIRAAYKIICE